ncbi:glycosyltransferase [Polyangium sp. y55x31]|uniref:glycosyltransferase n=1 Tax=Polyangium sp. y55x31 TaxID=3042688 RepID=UPI0024823B04|nr:glycosyltransferase [Polyangium sp. y55x31]MDI1483766.1 glycosyltransferase [Polyangium sp. y55x31]
MSGQDPARPAVAFLLGTAFSFTETFLFNQMRSLTRYRAITLCHRVANEERFPWTEPRFLGRGHPSRLGQAFRPLHGRLALDPAWMQALAETRATVLHGQFGTNGLVAAVYGKKLGLPVVTSFYGGDVGILLEPQKHLRRYWHYILGRRALFEGSDLVLVLSTAMRDDLVRLGCPASKLAIHPNGVDLERFSPVPRADRKGPLSVVMCGREIEKKGFSYGFRAVHRARAAGADLRVRWLPAPGPLGASLRALIEDLGLGPHVEILDPKTDPAVVMRESDLMLCPSVTAADGDKEGVPTVLVEASGTGLPAVASRHAGIPEIVVDGESGLLYAERDEEGLAAGLVRLAKDPVLRARMGEAARKKALATYDARKLAVTLEAHYDALRALAPRRALD